MSLFWEIVIISILLGTIFVIIMENRNPFKTLAWVLVLTFVPVVGIIIYIAFGMNNRHRRLISAERLSVLKDHITRNYKEEINPIVPAADAQPDEDDPHIKLKNVLYTTNQSYVLHGNSVEPFINFDDMLEHMLADMDNAKKHIHFLFFKFEHDAIGDRVADMLIKKAQQGLEVRVMYDDIACFTVSKKFYKRMAENGIEVTPFARVYIPFLTRNTNYRNHRKIVVIDGEIGYLGGMNIAERYSVGVHGGIWRDTHMRLQGPAVSELQTAFLVDWQFASEKFVHEDKYYPKVASAGNIDVQIATSGPMDKWDVNVHGFIEAITQARKYVYLQSPYFLPTETLLYAMHNAAMAGVDIRLMIPIRGDKGILPPLASRSYIRTILNSGVKVYFYDNGYLHAKTIVADDNMASIGSTNIDFRSLEQDFEVNAYIYNQDFAKQMKQIFIDDMKYCKEIKLEDWKNRPKIEKIKESFARLFSPLL